MASADPVGSIKVPKLDNWPGPLGAYHIVKPYLQPQIWNLISVFGLTLLFSLISDFVFNAGISRDSLLYVFLNDIAALIIGAFSLSALFVMYFTYFQKEDMSLSKALKWAANYFPPMLGLIFIMVVIFLASFILLIIPFFFILPRVYLAPYFLIKYDLSVDQAIAASWHSTKGNVGKVYGIIAIEVALAIPSIVILSIMTSRVDPLIIIIAVIYIPLAIYIGIINTGSFGLLTLYLSQPKGKAKLKSQSS